MQETTEKVVGERRLRTLRDLAAQSIQAKAVEEVCSITAETLAQNPYDIPFACLYLLDDACTEAHLAGNAGIEAGTTISPPSFKWDTLDPHSPLLSFKQAAESGQIVEIKEVSARFGALPVGAWEIPPEIALILPITLPGNQKPRALLLAGVSPMKALDNAYLSFLDLVAGQVSNSIAEARAYEEERKRTEALAELDRAKTAFFSNVSHEFRTPLTLILGPMEEALNKGHKALEGESLETVHRNSLRLLKLVNTLLDFSRIEAGRMQAAYEPTDLGGYTAELVSLFRSSVEKAGMQLLVDCPSLSQPVYVDREMWEKIVLNLLSNAFKFTEQGSIEVALRETLHSAVLTVRDTGTGISDEQLPHIFERFHRVEGRRARTHEGTGIGLALVSELVKLHGGQVTVASRVGEGTTFTLSLPKGTAHLAKEHLQQKQMLSSTVPGANPYIAEALRWLPDQGHTLISAEAFKDREPLEESVEDLAPPKKSKGRIIVADDNADMRSYVSGLLDPFYDVIAVSNGRVALNRIKERLPDLVLSDVMMPGLDGFELLRELRADERTRTLPVIFLSARAGEEARVEGLEAQADDYLTKPFSAKELLARVASHLKMARIRKEATAERERLLEELKVERNRLTDIFMQSPAFIAVLRGREHVFERANPCYFQLVGHRDLIGKSVREAFPEVESQGFFEILDEVYRTKKPFVGEAMRIFLRAEADAPPRERYLDFVFQPLIEADGSVSGIFVHGVDLTERKQTEEALQESEGSLHLAIDGAHLGTFYCTVPFEKILWNNTCKEHFFLPHDAEVDFNLFYSLLHPDDRELTRQAIDRAMSEHVQYNVEYRVVAPDGRMRWINAIGRGYYAETGEPTRFDGITIDITEKKTQERALKLLIAINDATRALYEPKTIMGVVARLLGEHLEASRCAYAPVEDDENHFTVYEDYTDGCPSSAGRYALTDFGPRAVEKLRAGHTYILNDRDREGTLEDNLAAFEAIEIQAIICTALLKDGKLTAMMAVHQSKPRTWSAEEIKLVEMVAERSWAIIERARADTALRERSEEIASLNVRLKRSMTETHHRVKNNLQLMSALIELQRQDDRDSISFSDLLRLKQNIQALGVIHDILTKESKEDGDAAFLSGKRVLETFLPILQGTLGARRLVTEIEEVSLPGKQVTSLAIVANELIANAVKHGKGDIELMLHVKDDRITLEVCDDGPGFAADFDPEIAANTGLELIENIARFDLRGETSYENRETGGARIVIAFPVSRFIC